MYIFPTGHILEVNAKQGEPMIKISNCNPKMVSITDGRKLGQFDWAGSQGRSITALVVPENPGFDGCRGKEW